MLGTMKLIATVFSFAVLIGCAAKPPPFKSDILTTIPDAPMVGKTYALFPLDETKARKLETKVIFDETIKGLTQTGLRLGELHGDLPSYMLLYDYATELGIQAAYEQVYLLIAYDVSGGRRDQVYKARVTVNSADKNPVAALALAIQSVTTQFPNQLKR